MKIKDVMRQSVVSLPQNGTFQDVMQKFITHHIDSLPILDAAQRVVGLITIDDLVDVFLPKYYQILRDFSALEDKGQLASLFDLAFTGLERVDEKLILAADVMNSKIQWVLQEDSLLQAAARLQAQNCQRLPVVDRDQKLVGMISDFEIVLALLRGTPSARAAAAS
jgi:CBS domain-containing membrane protein